MIPESASKRRLSEDNITGYLAKDSGSDNLSSVPHSDSESDTQNESRLTRRCAGCGGRFVPTGQQRFCGHDCYGRSLRVPIEQRFWVKVNKNGPVPAHMPHVGPCWLWTGATIGTRSTYGAVAGRRDGKAWPRYAHRVAWELTNGPIPDGQKVCHHCDVMLCTNPAHLFLGTQRDNLHDAEAKGRLVFGIGARKLSDDEYAEILRPPYRFGSGLDLARKLGVSKTTISRIRNGHSGVIYRSLQAAMRESA